MTNLETLDKAMMALGFTKIVNKISWKQDGCHVVHAHRTKHDTLDLSSDFHWGSKSNKMSQVVGGEHFEHVNAHYNKITVAEQFEAKGYTVEVEDELNEEGEIEMLITLEDWS